MSKLKQQIEADFNAAFKSQNKPVKSCLGLLKTKITEAEKKHGSINIEDDDIIKIVLSEVKKRDQTITAISTNPNAAELIAKEEAEKKMLQVYLPVQIGNVELKTMVKEFIELTNNSDVSFMRIHIVRHFNQQYKGQFSNEELKKIVEELLQLVEQ